MSAFTKWYLERLKTHPMSTNIVSGIVLMLFGDVGAQELEMHYFGVDKQDEITKDKLTYRRYGTLSPDIRLLKEELDRNAQDGALITTAQWQEQARSIRRNLGAEIESLDFFRMSTMCFWAGMLSTPFFILLYRAYDRVLPMGTTPFTVGARVGMNFVFSIPVNAAFFSYGTFVHHVTKWLGLVAEWRHEVPSATWRHLMRQVPFDFDMFWSTLRLKIETELPRTVLTSASIWIPINVINFSLVPPHLRPLVLSFFSALWNCYLSLAQHREANIEA